MGYVREHVIMATMCRLGQKRVGYSQTHLSSYEISLHVFYIFQFIINGVTGLQ